jgi:hypothetical protein
MLRRRRNLAGNSNSIFKPVEGEELLELRRRLLAVSDELFDLMCTYCLDDKIANIVGRANWVLGEAKVEVAKRLDRARDIESDT